MYEWEKFHDALRYLVAPEPQRDRLINAWVHALSRVDVQNLPPSLRISFQDLMGTLSSVKPTEGEGSIAASVASLSDEQVDEAAEEIVGLYGEISRLQSDD